MRRIALCQLLLNLEGRLPHKVISLAKTVQQRNDYSSDIKFLCCRQISKNSLIKGQKSQFISFTCCVRTTYISSAERSS